MNTRRNVLTYAVITLMALFSLAPMNLAVAAEMSASYYPQYDNYWTGSVMNGAGGYSKHNADVKYGKDPPDDKWQGWVKIDLSDLPDNAVITAASFFYNVISQSDPGPATLITLIADDPVTVEPELLWNDIKTGPVVSPELVTDRGWVERPLDAAGIAGVQAALSQDWVAFGIYKFDDTETKGHAKGYEAAKFRPYLKLTYAAADMGIKAIYAPAGDIPSGTPVAPAVTVENRGELNVPFRLWLSISADGNELYREYLDMPGIEPGAVVSGIFPPWVADDAGGERMNSADIELVVDANPADNHAVSWFNVVRPGDPPPPPPPSGSLIWWGWQETDRVPLAPSARAVKAGGWLAVDPVSGLIYGSKGNKTGEFMVWDVILDRWRSLASMPAAARLPGTGSKAVADGNGSIYVVNGANSVQFWRYDIAQNSWERLPDVPFGNSGKKVKGGTGMAHIVQYGLDYIYLLKGPKSDFLRYSVQAGQWEALADAPQGAKPKWDRGSWLVYDGDGKLYAHKAKVHELWAYDLAADAWGSQLPGMPLTGSSYRNTKSKNGSSAAWREGTIYSIKGGKSGEFWQYDPASRAWIGLPPMPLVGTTLRSVGVSDGGDLVSYPFGRVFYALKGNRTLEYWRYIMEPLKSDGVPSGSNGVAAGSVEPVEQRAAVMPNPVSGDRARIAYQVRAGGSAQLSVFDAVGRQVVRRAVELNRQGNLDLDVRSLSAGTYLFRIEGDNASLSGRVVVNH